MPGSVEDILGDFIANAALYQKLDLNVYDEHKETPNLNLRSISPILRYCSHEKCKAERPFRQLILQYGFKENPPRVLPREVGTKRMAG